MELNAPNNKLKVSTLDKTTTPSTEVAVAAAPHDAMDVLAAAASKSPTAALATKPAFTPDVAPTVTTAASHTGKDIATTNTTNETKIETANALDADVVDESKVTSDVAAAAPAPTAQETVSTELDKEESKSDGPPAAVSSPPADDTTVTSAAAADVETPTTKSDAPDEKVESSSTSAEQVKTPQEAEPTITPATIATTGSDSAAPAAVPTTTTTTIPTDALATSAAAATTTTISAEIQEEEDNTDVITEETPVIVSVEAASVESAAADVKEEATESKTAEDDSHAENPTAGDDTATTTESVQETEASTATIKSEQQSPAASTEATATAAASASVSSAATPAPAMKIEQPETTTTTTDEAPPAPAPLRPSLRGKLQLGSKGVAEWTGQWGMDDDAFKPGGFLSQFMYKYTRAAPAPRGVTPPPIPLALPLQLKDGYFSGFFMMGSTVPGGATVRVDERNVLLRFTAHDGQDEDLSTESTVSSNSVKVRGSGKNKFGAFVLEGEMDTAALTLSVYREYKVRARRKTPAARRTSLAPPSTVLKSGASSVGGYGAFATPGPDSNVAMGGVVPPPTAGLIPRGLQFGIGDESMLYSSSRVRPERMRRMPSHLNLDSSNPLAKVSTVLSEMVASDKERYFCVPVDPIALGIPEYLTVVKLPMDLGTVMKNVAEKVYHDEDEVLEHIRLTFQNAMNFNPVAHPIHKMAAQYLQLFDNKWDKVLMDRVREAERVASRRKGSKTVGASSRKRKGDEETGSVTGSVSSRKPVKKIKKKKKKKDKKKSGKKRRKTDSSDEDNSSDEEASSEESESEAESSESESSEDESSSDDGSSDDESSRKRKKGKKKKKKKKAGKDDKIRELQRQLDRLKKPDPKKKKKKKPKSTKKAKTSAKTPARRTSTSSIATASKSKKSHARQQRPMSYQEKRTLGNDIRKCTSDQVNRVISIIRENGGHLGGTGDEVELDIDALDTKIQWLLHAYVRKCLLHSDPHPGVNDGEDDDSY